MVIHNPQFLGVFLFSKNVIIKIGEGQVSVDFLKNKLKTKRKDTKVNKSLIR